MNKKTSIIKACKLTDEAFEYILPELKTGITEKEIASKIDKFFKKNGAKLAFPTIVAFGKSAYEIHHKPNKTKLKKDQFVLFDIGAKINGYCADMSRTVYFGKAGKEEKKIYNAVLEAQEKAIKAIKNNIKTYELDRIARDYIYKKGFDPIPHSLGHGVDKKVHALPHISPATSDIIKIGDIFTIEPGIYIKNFGGVRIEDVIILEKSGTKSLTCSQKTLIEL